MQPQKYLFYLRVAYNIHTSHLKIYSKLLFPLNLTLTNTSKLSKCSDQQVVPTPTYLFLLRLHETHFCNNSMKPSIDK